MNVLVDLLTRNINVGADMEAQLITAWVLIALVFATVQGEQPGKGNWFYEIFDLKKKKERKKKKTSFNAILGLALN